MSRYEPTLYIDRDIALKKNWKTIMEMKRPAQPEGMTQPMTPEREKEIRNFVTNGGDMRICWSAMKELLTEIDVLQWENENLKSDLITQEHLLGSRNEILEHKNSILIQALEKIAARKSTLDAIYCPNIAREALENVRK
jgi:hypothetical protein